MLTVSSWVLTALFFFLPRGPSHFSLTVFSLGQNELLHIEFEGRKNWLINTGRGAPSDQARWTVGPFLRRKGTGHLEGVLLTDFSKRHTGGLSSLSENFSIGALFFPFSKKASAEKLFMGQSRRNQRINTRTLQAGEVIRAGEKSGFQVLDVIDGFAFILIYQGDEKILFLPTWKADVLARALPELNKLSSVDMLLLPAQGSPDPAQWSEILSLTLPRWVVLTESRADSGPLIASLQKEEIPFFCLSETGALQFEVGPEKWQISAFG
jgi:hypothetical protein